MLADRLKQSGLGGSEQADDHYESSLDCSRGCSSCSEKASRQGSGNVEGVRKVGCGHLGMDAVEEMAPARSWLATSRGLELHPTGTTECV